MERPILFFWPDKDIGGGGIFFLRIAQELIRQGSSVWIADVEGGFISSRIKGAQRVIYSDWDTGWDVPEGCDSFLALGVASMAGSSLRLPGSSRLCFVSIHHHELFSWYSWGFIYKKLFPSIGVRLPKILEPFRHRVVENLIQFLNKNNALHYVCDFNASYDRNIVSLENLSFIPIPIPEYKKTAVGKKKGFVWLSRISNEKLIILETLINSISRNSNTNFILIIIGNGDGLARIRKTCEKKRVPAIFAGKIEGPDISKYLSSYDCICFGVGTSILELASMGYPSYVVSFLRPSDKSKQYTPVYRMANYDMAVGPFSDTSYAMNFEQVLKSNENQEAMHLEGERCRKHVLDNFDLYDVAQKVRSLDRTKWPESAYFMNKFSKTLIFPFVSKLKKNVLNVIKTTRNRCRNLMCHI